MQCHNVLWSSWNKSEKKTHAPQNGLFKTKYCNYLELLVNSSRTYAHMLCAGLKFLVEPWTVQWNRAEGAIKTTAAKLSNWLILEFFIYTHSILFYIFFCCGCCIHSFGVLTFLWNVVENIIIYKSVWRSHLLSGSGISLAVFFSAVINTGTNVFSIAYFSFNGNYTKICALKLNLSFGT